MSGEAEWRAEEYVALGGRKRWRVHISDDLIISSLDEPTARLIAASRETRDALHGIMRDLPSNKDWLDPVLEAEACAALAKSRVKP